MAEESATWEDMAPVPAAPEEPVPVEEEADTAEPVSPVEEEPAEENEQDVPVPIDLVGTTLTLTVDNGKNLATVLTDNNSLVRQATDVVVKVTGAVTGGELSNTVINVGSIKKLYIYAEGDTASINDLTINTTAGVYLGSMSKDEEGSGTLTFDKIYVGSYGNVHCNSKVVVNGKLDVSTHYQAELTGGTYTGGITIRTDGHKLSDLLPTDGSYCYAKDSYETTASGRTITGPVTVMKKRPGVQGPTEANTDITYGDTTQLIKTGTDVSAGTGGTMEFAVNDSGAAMPDDVNGGWSETVPSAQNTGAGTDYYVWWRVKPADGYAGEKGCVGPITINQATPTITFTAGKTTLTYGESFSFEAEVKADGVDPSDITGTIKFMVDGDGVLSEQVIKADQEGKAGLIALEDDQGKSQILFGDDGHSTVTAIYYGNENLNQSSSSDVTVDVTPKALDITFTATDRAYDGSKKVTGSLIVTTALVPGDIVTATLQEGGATAASANVGTQNVTVEPGRVTLTGRDANYYKVGTITGGTVTIKPAPATCTEPTANDPTYTGAAQALVTAGTPAGGKMMYALGEDGVSAPEDTAFGDAIPSGTGAGTYYVWYYVKASDDNHEDSDKACVTVTIKKAEVSFTVDGNSHTYDGTPHTATVKNSTGSAPALAEGNDYTVTYGGDRASSQTNVDDYNIYITLTNGAAKNYKFAGQSDDVKELMVGQLTISKATSSVTNVIITNDGEGEGLTYGDTFTISAEVSAPGSMTGKVTFSAGSVTLGEANSAADGKWTVTVGADKAKQHAIYGTGADTTITATYDDDGNIAGSSGTKTGVTVEQRPLTYTVSATSRTWNGGTGVEVKLDPTNEVAGDDVTLTAKGNLDDGKAGTYTQVNLTEVQISGTDMGYYTVDTEQAGAKLKDSVGITKANSSVTAPVGKSGLTYTGAAQQLVDAATGVTGGTAKYYVGEKAPDNKSSDWKTDAAKITGVNAGEYTVWYYVQGDANHNDTTPASVKVTIAKAPVSFTVSGNSCTYDTGAHKAAVTQADDEVQIPDGGYSVVYADSESADSGSGAESQTNAGAYDIWVKLNNGNFKFEDTADGTREKRLDEKLTIDQAALDLAVNAVAITYGAALTNDLLGGTATISGGTVIPGTWAWESMGVYPAVSDSGETEYKVTFTPETKYQGNFTEASLSTTITITVDRYVLTPAVVASSVTGRDYNGTTDVTGGTLEFENMGIFNSDPFKDTKPTISGTFAYTSRNAGTNTVKVTGIKFETNGDNYSLSADKIDGAAVNGAIGQKMVELTWQLDGEDTFNITYDGKAHNVTAAAATSVGEETVNVTVTGGAQTNAGSYTATAAGLTDGDGGGLAGNYKLPADVERSYTIAPATVSFIIGEEDKADWDAKGETNGDPNPKGYTWEGSGTDYTLTMTYDSYGHKANVVQTAGETVKIAAGNANGFTVSYKKGETELAQVRDAGTYEIWVTINPAEGGVYNYVFSGQGTEVRRLKLGEITVKPYETAVSWTHLNYVYHGHAMHPEIRVLSPFKADDKQMDVGLPEDFDIEEPGAYAGDYLVAFAQTEGSQVDSYTVTAALYGKNAGNYTITDDTETVTIVPAPVTFTVGDNIWIVQEGGTLSRNTVTLRAAWGAVTAEPDKDESKDHQYPAAGTKLDVEELSVTIQYRKDGVEVEGTPTEAGTYQVWVTIGNNNFRHAAAADGASRHVGELIVTDNPENIRTYTVTFDPGYEGATGDVPADMTGVFANQTVVIPPAGVTREDFIFQGWSYNGRTYQPNEEFHMPASNVTFKAEWVKVAEIGGTVLREREDSSGGDPTPVNGARVVLKHGSEQIAETTTNSSGYFTFPPAAPGVYNLEVTYENGSHAKIVKTFLVTLEDSGSPDGKYILPAGALNTVVEVAPGIMAAANIDSLVSGKEDSEVYTQEDKQTVLDGGTVEFKMNVGSAGLTQDQTKTVPVPEEQIGMVLDMTLTKTVTKSGSSTSTETSIHDTKTLVTTVIHLPAELQGKSSYTIYRFHDTSNADDDKTLEMQAITTSPNSEGEYLRVVRGGTAIEVHAKFYSTYVLTWKQSSGGYWPTVDKSKLNAAIMAAEALNEADYTAESWAELETALAAAKTVAAKYGATQTEVDAALNALTTAQAALEKKGEEQEPGPGGDEPGGDIPAPPVSGTGWSHDHDTGDWYFYKNGKLITNDWVGKADGASIWDNNWYYVGADGKMLTGLQYLTDLHGGYGWYMLQPTDERGEIGKMLTGFQWTYDAAVGEGWFSPVYGEEGKCRWASKWGDYNAATGLWTDGLTHIG